MSDDPVGKPRMNSEFVDAMRKWEKAQALADEDRPPKWFTTYIPWAVCTLALSLLIAIGVGMNAPIAESQKEYNYAMIQALNQHKRSIDRMALVLYAIDKRVNAVETAAMAVTGQDPEAMRPLPQPTPAPTEPSPDTPSDKETSKAVRDAIEDRTGTDEEFPLVTSDYLLRVLSSLNDEMLDNEIREESK